MTRVAYIGNFKHPHCTEVALSFGLRQNGCEVIEIQEDQATPAALTKLHDLDLALYTRTHNVHAIAGQTWTDTFRTLEDRGTQTAAFHLDRFWGLARERAIWDREPMFTVGTVFTADGGNDERWAEAGVNHVWLPPAIDGRYAHEGLGVRSPVKADVLFVGSTRYHPEYPQRDQMVNMLRSHYGDRFLHVGYGSRITGYRLDALADLIAACKVVVGDSCFANAPGHVQHRRSDRYWSDRIPETLGRAGVLVHADVPGLRSQFRDGNHLLLHEPGDWRAMIRQIDRAVECGDETRREIGLAGQAHVQACHTYTDRAASMLETLGLRGPQPRLDDRMTMR